jgi:hypothetical protein
MVQSLLNSLVVTYKDNATTQSWNCIYPADQRTYVPTKTCMWMFLLALFIIAKTSSHPSPSALDKQIVAEQWVEYYSAT